MSHHSNSPTINKCICLHVYMHTCIHIHICSYAYVHTHTLFFFSTAVLKSWSLTSASHLLVCNRQNQSCSPWNLEAAESSIPSAPSPQSLENPLGTYFNWISGQSIAMNLLLASVPMQTHLQEAMNSALKTLHPAGPWELAEQNEHHVQKKIPTLGPQIGPQLQVPVVVPSQPWDKEWGWCMPECSHRWDQQAWKKAHGVKWVWKEGRADLPVVLSESKAQLIQPPLPL